MLVGINRLLILLLRASSSYQIYAEAVPLSTPAQLLALAQSKSTERSGSRRLKGEQAFSGDNHGPRSGLSWH